MASRLILVWVLGYLLDQQTSLVLAVAVDLVDALLGLVTNRGNFIGLDASIYDFGGDNCLNFRCPHHCFIAINSQQGRKLHSFLGVFLVINFNSVAFRDDVLVSSYCDNGFFHNLNNTTRDGGPCKVLHGAGQSFICSLGLKTFLRSLVAIPVDERLPRETPI